MNTDRSKSSLCSRDSINLNKIQAEQKKDEIEKEIVVEDAHEEV